MQGLESLQQAFSLEQHTRAPRQLAPPSSPRSANHITRWLIRRVWLVEVAVSQREAGSKCAGPWRNVVWKNAGRESC